MFSSYEYATSLSILYNKIRHSSGLTICFTRIRSQHLPYPNLNEVRYAKKCFDQSHVANKAKFVMVIKYGGRSNTKLVPTKVRIAWFMYHMKHEPFACGPMDLLVSRQPFQSDDQGSNPARSAWFNRVITVGRLLTYNNCLSLQIHSRVTNENCAQ